MKAHLIRSAFYLLLLLAFSIGGTLLAFFRSEEQTKTSRPAAAGLTFAQRVAYQQAIEDVYWRHRIWPKERPDTKPSLSAVMSQAQLENKVADYLRKSDALEEYWQRPVAAEQLQAEMNRMAQDTKQPEVLHELFEALENDPFVIAECLARPALSERFETNSHAHHQRVHGELKQLMSAASANYALPAIADGPNGCADDTWIPTSITNAPAARFYPTAVWTGSEMIVWGGVGIGNAYLNTGGTYNPSTDSWTATSTTNAPDARGGHTAVWTGSEMIVWGGSNGSNPLKTGGRYCGPPPPPLTIIQPNGGEVWSMGSVQQIKWEASNLTQSDRLIIQYSRDGGATWGRIAQDVPALSLSYSWHVDNYATTQGRMKILLQGHLSITDESDAKFTVQ